MKPLPQIILIVFFCYTTVWASESTPIIYHEQATVIPAQTEPTSNWILNCTSKKYPDRGAAITYTHGRQVTAEICSATQTIEKNFHHHLIVATSEITPFALLFKIDNFIAQQVKARLVFANKKQFKLYADCHDSFDHQSCVFILAHKKSHTLAKKLMLQNDYFTLRIYDKESKQPIDLVFSLIHSKQIFKKIIQNENQIKIKFKQTFAV